MPSFVADLRNVSCIYYLSRHWSIEVKVQSDVLSLISAPHSVYITSLFMHQHLLCSCLFTQSIHTSMRGEIDNLAYLYIWVVANAELMGTYMYMLNI